MRGMTLLVGCGLFFLLPGAVVAEPMVAKKGVGVATTCWLDHPQQCRPLQIPSPNRKSLIEVRYHRLGALSLNAYLRVTTEGREIVKASPRDPDTGSDVLWSPDSTKFYLSGSGGSSIGPMYVDIYRVDDPKLDPIDVTALALKDMVSTFPPCRAKNVDMYDCHELTDDPGSFISMSGVDWLPDSSAIVVMAQVMPSSRFGGIMGQIMGYVLEVPTGKILQRMEAREFARKWKRSLAFKIDLDDLDLRTTKTSPTK